MYRLVEQRQYSERRACKLLDLSASVYRYVPWLPAAVVKYLKSSVLAGSSDDVRLRLKGDLAQFPFADPSQGLFQVIAKVHGVRFHFADQWSALSALNGDLVFDGRSRWWRSAGDPGQRLRSPGWIRLRPDVERRGWHVSH